MPPATQRTQRKRPGDLTGVRGQTMAKEAAARKLEEKAQVTQALDEERAEKKVTEVDYSTRAVVKRVPREVTTESEVNGETVWNTDVIMEDIEVKKPTRRIRVNWPIDDMTYGREILSPGVFDDNGIMIQAPIIGSLRNYTFEEGRWYTVDAELADHLDFLGYTYGE